MKKQREKKKVLCKQIPTDSSITCGTENPATLGCEFYELEDKEVATIFVPKSIHEGHCGIMHGGLSGAVLDELMGRATLSYCQENTEDWIPRYMTAEMTVKYKQPIYVGDTVYGYGRVDRREGRCCFVTAELVNEEQDVLAFAEGVYVEVKVLPQDTPEYRTSHKKREKIGKKDPKEL